MFAAKPLPLSLLTMALMASYSSHLMADDASVLEQITIFGQQNPLNTAPASAHEITQAELDTFKYTDIMRTLATIPGIYIQEEDGYGLRPNIGMRGTGQNRSEKITVMEDGVLAAPAPYASPAAYYFPTPGRMERIEAMKGGSTIQYGPRTTGGVLNLVSRSIPTDELAGNLDVALGQDGFAKAHVYGGGQGEQVGAVAEIFRYQADGFRDINHVGGNSGFVRTDALAKVSLHSDADATYAQQLQIKLKYSDETSNETYMGLTSADYHSAPWSRYSASQNDQMVTDHQQLQVNHVIEFSPELNLSSVAYYNAFHRNWYKVNKINGKSLASGGIELASAFDAGTSGLDSLAVEVKANNRDYLSQGIQTQVNWDVAQHQVTVGLRYHEDQMDRFQWVDNYQLTQQYHMTLAPEDAGIPGTDSNRIDSANAWAMFVEDKMSFDQLAITLGMRYEDIETRRQDWGKTNPGRVGEPSKDIRNHFDALLPAAAVSYAITDQWLVFTGVQKGFAPAAPGNSDGDVEKSWNYELGARFNQDDLQAEAVAFYSDYSNMHGNCTAAQGCDDDNIGNQYNAGAVDVKGFELSGGYTLNAQGQVSFPIKMAYTYTQAEFSNSFDSDFWGQVNAGDELPYLPSNQMYLSIGAETAQWQVTVAGRYTSDIRTDAGHGAIPSDELIESKTVVDLAARYFISEQQEVYLQAENLLDETYMTTRIHGSIFSGKPRSLTLGYSYQF
ncbi:TonB-dependent receptor domain-containing protein [Shewanella sp. NIFS-20-20]|uniref:TonB-dependent receptor family protein n=1 Tax=Shewanella sp. NIFS-20-20 TaxID=2853806 RepID=UPI001C455F0C|nr:TonB-dependent receptor [Shewanella sp. NIFS-20-20]MBV7314142.1 TonB-dependent receptor [Shewanella sp. NIFS-20-20]